MNRRFLEIACGRKQWSRSINYRCSFFLRYSSFRSFMVIKKFLTNQMVVPRSDASRPRITTCTKDQYIVVVVKWNRRAIPTCVRALQFDCTLVERYMPLLFIESHRELTVRLYTLDFYVGILNAVSATCHLYLPDWGNVG